MKEVLFTNANDISNEWLFYIENEAKSLAQREEFAIENYLDREMFNPQVALYLETEEATKEDENFATTERFSFNLTEELRLNILPNWLRPRFIKLKIKVKKIFCNVVNGIENLDSKEIIRAILLALIPAFAAGLPAAILPIVIGLIAYLYKYGINRTCPV